MKGLLRNNLYAVRSDIQVFSGIMFVLGIFVVAMDNDIQTLIDGYMLIAMIGFSRNAIASLRNESTTKWTKYKLTTPVRRTTIITSYYINQFIWLSVGMIFAAVSVTLSILVHGYPFDRSTDIFMLFVVGISISLFMGAIFFPLFYLGGEEKNEVIMIISLLCSIGLIMILTTAANIIIGDHAATITIILGGTAILAIAILTFLTSIPLTVWIYKKKQY